MIGPPRALRADPIIHPWLLSIATAFDGSIVEWHQIKPSQPHRRVRRWGHGKPSYRAKSTCHRQERQSDAPPLRQSGPDTFGTQDVFGNWKTRLGLLRHVLRHHRLSAIGCHIQGGPVGALLMSIARSSDEGRCQRRYVEARHRVEVETHSGIVAPNSTTRGHNVTPMTTTCLSARFLSPCTSNVDRTGRPDQRRRGAARWSVVMVHLRSDGAVDCHKSKHSRAPHLDKTDAQTSRAGASATGNPTLGVRLAGNEELRGCCGGTPLGGTARLRPADQRHGVCGRVFVGV